MHTRSCGERARTRKSNMNVFVLFYAIQRQLTTELWGSGSISIKPACKLNKISVYQQLLEYLFPSDLLIHTFSVIYENFSKREKCWEYFFSKNILKPLKSNKKKVITDKQKVVERNEHYIEEINHVITFNDLTIKICNRKIFFTSSLSL